MMMVKRMVMMNEKNQQFELAKICVGRVDGWRNKRSDLIRDEIDSRVTKRK
jgi:hypothetical protein